MDEESASGAESPIRVVGIPGSLRPGSYTRLAVEAALCGARAVGAETRLLDLREFDLVFCDGERDDDHYPEGVRRLREAVAAAQGVILGTPEYHGGVSGVLKNALDLMGFREFEGKMIGLVGVSGGRLGAVHALSSLRTIGRSLHAWVLPEEVAIPQARRLFDAQGNLTDGDLADRLDHLGRQVARFAYLHCSEKAKEFVRLWEDAPANPGGARGN